MNAKKVSQYSVFLINQAGALKNLMDKLNKLGLNITALSSDVKYEAAILKFVADEKPGFDLSGLLTAQGYTNVKTDAICVELPFCNGVIEAVSNALTQKNVNIINIYGSCSKEASKIILVVNDLETALEALNDSGVCADCAN